MTQLCAIILETEAILWMNWIQLMRAVWLHFGLKSGYLKIEIINLLRHWYSYSCRIELWPMVVFLGQSPLTPFEWFIDLALKLVATHTDSSQISIVQWVVSGCRTIWGVTVAALIFLSIWPRLLWSTVVEIGIFTKGVLVALVFWLLRLSYFGVVVLISVGILILLSSVNLAVMGSWLILLWW